MARDFDVDWQEGERAAELTVCFSDQAAVEHSDLVERSVAVIRGFPGVQRAEQEDRELIVVVGQIDPAALERMLVAWWMGQLG